MTFPDRLDLTVYMDLHDEDDVLVLDGTTSQYVIDTSWAAWTDDENWTFEFWFRTTQSGDAFFVNILRNSDNAVMLTVSQDSFDYFDFGFASWGQQVDRKLNDGVPHHVAITEDYGADLIVLYIDGKVATYTAPSGKGTGQETPPIGTAQLLLGQFRSTIAGSMSLSLAGEIYDFRFWDGVTRTAKQILDSYQLRLTGSESGLATYWKLDEGTGSTANDSTSSNEDGSIAGGSGVWTKSSVTKFFTDVTDGIDPASKPFKWSSVLGQAVDTCGFSLQEWTGTKPEEWDEVVIYDGTTRIFGGFATQVITSEGGDVEQDFYIGGSDYGIYLEHVLVKHEFVGYYTDYGILHHLFAEYVPWIRAMYTGYGVPITGHVEQIKTYSRIRFNRQFLRPIINQLAGNANANWFISPDKELYFFANQMAYSPYDISDSPDLSTTFPASGIARQEGSAKLVNRVEVVGGYYPSQDETFIFPGTGEEKRIIMPFRMVGPEAGGDLEIWRNDAVPATNYIDNPSFEVNITDGWNTYENGSGGAWAQDSTHAMFGTYACKITAGDDDNTALRLDSTDDTITVADQEKVYLSAYVWCASNNYARMRIYDVTNTTIRKTGDVGGGGSGWERLTLSWQNQTGNPVTISVYLENLAGDSSTAMWWDGVMLTKGLEFVPNYIDGTQDDCSWSGTAHNSDSSRAEGAVPSWTELNLIDPYTEQFSSYDDVAHYYEDRVLALDEPWPNLTNACKVFGRYEVPLRTRYSDNVSFEFYGHYFDEKIIDTAIIDKGTARIRAKAMLAERAYGSVTITCHVRQPGLLSGQLVHFDNTLFSIDNDFLIQRVDADVNVYGNVAYSLSLGLWNDDLIDLILKLMRLTEPDVPWREGEVLDELLSQGEILELTETTYAPTADSGPYKWDEDDWGHMTWS